MEETIKITLAGSYSKKSSDQTSSLGAGLHANKNTLPEDSIMEELSLDSLFRQERFDSNKFRVIIELCPVISNPLFNPVTEVVKREGDNIKILNFGPNASVDGVVEKGNGFEWTEYEAVRDTQLSNNECGYTYFCGKDIFNNHILRSTTHKSVAKSSNGPSENFNTIDDTLRNIYGEELEHDDTLSSYFNNYTHDRTAHLYSVDDIYTFNEAIANRLEERNGWFGFVNRTKMPIWPPEGEPYDIYKVINSEPSAKYITLYPGADEFSLIPSYNNLTERTESNWNYCLTYPSSSTTEGINFLADDGSVILAVFEQDENSRIMRCVSYPKHGLVDGDVVNVYVDGVIEYQSVVVTIEDEYTFTAPLEMSYTISGDTDTVVSFKKVVDGVENQYYVRIFSRLPNFRFADKAVTPENLYGDGSDLIERYQTLDNEFEKHISSMGFAQTIFADKTCQIVFTDDIDVSYLKDNLGRPLTEIYLTVVKNNKGHKEWYSGEGTVSVSDVERSSCFGKLTCGFWITDGEDEDKMSNAKHLTNIGENAVSGLNITTLNGTGGTEDADAITYEEDVHYYGDFCSYSPTEDYEETIQPVLFRFNTAQRECDETTMTTVFYDEIIRDDYMMSPPSLVEKISGMTYTTGTPFVTEKFEEDLSGLTYEGYYYEPHFKIPLKEFAVERSYGDPFVYNCMSITKEDDGTYVVYTEEYNYADKGESVIFFDKEEYKAYPAKVVDVLSGKKFSFEAEEGMITGETVPTVALVRRPEDIPMYANFITDGSCEFSWREIHNSGTDLANEYDEYPFSNGRHYVTKKFNLFLRRQDPYGENNLYDPESTSAFNSPYGVVGKQTAYDDVYTKEKDSEC